MRNASNISSVILPSMSGLPAKEVKALVRIGDPVALLIQDFAEIGNLVTGQAMDNRACYRTHAVPRLQKIKRVIMKLSSSPWKRLAYAAMG